MRAAGRGEPGDPRRGAAWLAVAASGRAISVNRMLELTGELLGMDARADYAEPRPGDIKHSLARIELAGELIG